LRIRTHLSICLLHVPYYPFTTERLTSSLKVAIRCSYEGIGVLAGVSWYFSNQVHPAFLAQRTQCDVDAGELHHHFLKAVGHCAQLSGYFQQAPNEVQSGPAVSIGQKAIVSDSDKASGQGMEQEPADKGNGTDGGLLHSIVFTVFIPEAHPAILKAYEARVGDCHPVGVTG
jgi:hypothetical protein